MVGQAPFLCLDWARAKESFSCGLRLRGQTFASVPADTIPMKIRTLVVSIVFALTSVFGFAQTRPALPALSAKAAAALAAAGSDLGKIAAVAKAYPSEAALIARTAARADSAKAVEIAALVAKTVPAAATAVTTAVVQESQSNAGVIAAAVLNSTGTSNSIGQVRAIVRAAVSGLEGPAKTNDANLATIAQIVVASTGGSSAAARMGASDASGRSPADIARGSIDQTAVAAARTLVSTAVSTASSTVIPAISTFTETTQTAQQNQQETQQQTQQSNDAVERSGA